MHFDLKSQIATIHKLAEIGANHIRALRKFLEVRGVKVSEDPRYNSPHCLDVSFFGLRLLFRVEISLGPDETKEAVTVEPKAAIVTYRFSDASRLSEHTQELLQELGVRYSFNAATQGYFCAGPVVPAATGNDCSGLFFAEVFEKLVIEKAVLRP